MNITFENPEKVSGVITITIEDADYQEDVRKQLNDLRKRANIPGFRPGQAPLSLIKRHAGAKVKVDAINKVIEEKLQEYIRDNKINVLGSPMPSEQQELVDLDKPAPYTLKFDVAIMPELDVRLDKKSNIVFYDIQLSDKLVDDQIDAFASRSGSYEKVDSYEDNDMLKGDLRELNEDGANKEDGIVAADAVMMPSYIKVDEQKALFANAKVGDIITFNPKKAYPESPAEMASLLNISKEEAENVESDFTYQVTEITRYKKHDLNQELFDQVFGVDVVKDEESFRQKVTDGLREQLDKNADVRFLVDVRKYVEEMLGDVKYADDLIKRIMLASNKDKGREFVDENYEASIKELTWTSAKNILCEQTSVTINDDDVKEAAKEAITLQFAQYGMTNVPEDYLDNYVDKMLERPEQVRQFISEATDRKLTQALKNVVTLDHKEISFEDFSKLNVK